MSLARSWSWAWIVGCLVGLFGLAGCSALRIGYDQGPQLAWWWLHGYVDFASDEAPRTKEAIRQWFAWHRTTQLGGHADWLASLQRRTGDSVTPAELCRFNDELRTAIGPALDKALAAAAPLVAGLGEAQLRHLEQRFAKGNDEWRREHLQATRSERLEAQTRRSIERAENFYGRLSEAQRRLVATATAESPFDAEIWLAERQRRQRDTLQTLRGLLAEKADADRALPALRALADRFERPSDPAFRTMQARATAFNCELGARLHASASTEQRQALRDKLRTWESDLRALAASPL